MHHEYNSVIWVARMEQISAVKNVVHYHVPLFNWGRGYIQPQFKRYIVFVNIQFA